MPFKLRFLIKTTVLSHQQSYPGVDYTHLIDHIQPTYDNDPEFKYFLIILTILIRKAPQ